MENGIQVHLHWECHVCKEEYSSKHPFKEVKDKSNPNGPPCPGCEAHFPRFKGLKIVG